MQNHTPAQVNAETAIYTQARSSVACLVKQRARAYARRPLTLENVFPGLTAAAPEAMLAMAKHLFETERQTPRRWFGFAAKSQSLTPRP
jgi:hypothetical protein